MHVSTATWLSIAGVVAAGVAAFTANTAVLQHEPTPRPELAAPTAGTPVAVAPAAPVTAGGQVVQVGVPLPPSVPSGIPAVDDTTPSPGPLDAGMSTAVATQIFALGRLGELQVADDGSSIEVMGLTSPMRTTVERTAAGLRIYFSSTTERFRFDVSRSGGGLLGTLHRLAIPSTTPPVTNDGEDGEGDEDDVEDGEDPDDRYRDDHHREDEDGSDREGDEHEEDD